MNIEDKLKWLKTTLQTKFGVAIDVVDLEMNIGDLKIDSLDLVELQMEYEDQYSVEVPTVDYELVTVNDLIKLLP
jgi:acyl carrier protein